MNLLKPIVLFGNGDMPTHPEVHKKLQKARSFICIDGGADKVLSLGFKPDIILGDLDSISKNKHDYNCPVILLKDQSKNDLEKALQWCIEKKITKLDLIGFSGGRDDQYLVTMQIIKKYTKNIQLTLYTDTCVIYCIKDYIKIKTNPEQKVSILPFHSTTKITTKGLKFPLEFSELSSPSHGISNEALKNSIELHTNNWVLVFLHYTQ